MPVDIEQWQVEIGHFNGCLHHTIVKLKLNLFNIITSVSQVIMFLLAILHLCISKVNIVSCFYYLLYIVCHLLPQNSQFILFVCFKFRYLIKQIPILHCLNIINLISVISTGYVINLLLLLVQFNKETKKVTLDQRKSNPC